MTPTLRRALTLAATCALSVPVLAACGDDSSTSSGPATPATSSSSPTDSPAAQTGGVTEVAVTLANDGSADACNLDKTTAPAGPVTFTVSNQSATGITEVELQQDQKILGEKENVVPGLKPVSFTLTLGGGEYQFYCPGGSPETQKFTVTGQVALPATGSTATLLAQGAKEYSTYVDTQVGAMVTAVKKLQALVDAGKIEAAQAQYAEARPFYERAESDVEGFVLPGFSPTDNKGNLDYLVDMRASNLDPEVGWHGFHAVERDLFLRQRITASTRSLAAELTRNIVKLNGLVKTLKYKPEDLANGAAGLLEEVQSNKITGEEEDFSHIDLVDFAANVEGAQECFAYLKPGLKKIDATLTAQIAQRFAAVDTLLDTYRDPTAIGGYRIYTAALRKSDANKLSQTVQALQDSLSRLAEKVATA